MNDGWPDDFFDLSFADAVLDRPDTNETKATVSFLLDVLQVRRGGRLLDQGCGTGRLALPLVRHGFTVVGVDLASAYVERSNHRAVSESLPATFHAADASRWVPPDPCDGGFNWGTSFGFHDDRTRNAAMVRCAARGLVPGGRFVLDVANADRLRATLRPVWRQTVATGAGEVEILRRTHIDPTGARLVQEWTFAGAVRTSPRVATTWLHSREELVAMFEAAGLRVTACLGSVSAEPFGPGSERCILVGERAP